MPRCQTQKTTDFEQVCTRDEFGYGRFVRNLFEQAVTRQATRISELVDEEIVRDKLFGLQERQILLYGHHEHILLQQVE